MLWADKARDSEIIRLLQPLVSSLTTPELHRPVRLRFLPPSCHVGNGGVSNDERGLERPARTKSRSQTCRLGGRSEIYPERCRGSSDITMPLSLTTACAGSLAQLPPYDVEGRAFFGVSLVPGSDHEPGSRCPVCASRSNLRDAVSARYRDTNHSTLATAFLIYGTGIRNRAKPLKTLHRDPF
jgi:hypothetical protein